MAAGSRTARHPGAYVAITEIEYGLTDKLALSGRLPYIASRFSGSHDEPCMAELRQLYGELRGHGHGDEELASVDTGNYYATFQDFGVTLRYNLIDRGVTVTPLIGVTIPSHHYRTVGEAAPGQDRRALHIGVNVGRLLDPFVPDGYVHARYTFSFVEPLYGISLNRSNAEFEGGYRITPTLALRALGAWQQTHGGLTYYEALEKGFGTDTEPGKPELFLDHDRLLTNRYWHVGGGATVAVTDSLSVDGAVLTFVAGADSHYGIGLTVGASWRFRSGR